MKDSIKLMAIDDSPTVLEMVKIIFREEKYEVIVYTNAREALEEVNTAFDVILLDLSMPVMSGKEFLTELRKNNEFNVLPVIIFTAIGNRDEEIKHVFELGANDFIQKPFSSIELIARVNMHGKLKKTSCELVELNNKLNRELIKNEQMHKLTIDYSTTIENDLLDKLHRINQAAENEKNTTEKLTRENEEFKKEIEKLNMLYNTVVMHDSIIEDEMSMKLEKATKQATMDQLTQVYNRFKFYESLYEEINHQKQCNSSLSLIMFDIDHFKKINDTYGHDTGDTILVEITSLSKTIVRKRDTLARWGGEEFMVLVPDSNIESALGLAGRMRAVIAEHSFEKVEHVTCSFGVTQFQENDDIETFLKRVDEGLYDAKESGRNQVKSR